jgi:hypothetical protein
MNKPKSQEEAVAACNVATDNAWKAYSASHGIDEAQDPIAYGAAKIVFSAGFIFGAQYVTGFIIKGMKQPINEENKGQ